MNIGLITVQLLFAAICILQAESACTAAQFTNDAVYDFTRLKRKRAECDFIILVVIIGSLTLFADIKGHWWLAVLLPLIRALAYDFVLVAISKPVNLWFHLSQDLTTINANELLKHTVGLLVPVRYLGIVKYFGSTVALLGINWLII